MGSGYWWRQMDSPPRGSASIAPVYGVANKEKAETAVDASLCLLCPPKPGDPCPFCQQAALAYDALFLLTCPACQQVAEAGCFT